MSNLLDHLTISLQSKPWFSSVGTDEFNRLVVYAKYMDLEVLTSVPDYIESTPVLCYFTAFRDFDIKKTSLYEAVEL